MKLDTTKYKLTLMTEDVCPDCIELKKKLDEKTVPYVNKSITAANPSANANFNQDIDKVKTTNRWEFIDLSREFPEKVKFTPVMVIENLEGEKDVFSLGGGFMNTDEALEILKDYCI